MIYSKNVLLETAKRSALGWVKELCYQTLMFGELDDARILLVFDVFKARSSAVTPEPISQTDSRLQLVSLEHVGGVNALKAGEMIEFHEEGITLLYGKNGSGKSGYFRVLNHLSGGILAAPVLPNIYADAPVSAQCRIKYKLDGILQPEYFWDNTSLTYGAVPFNRVTVFDSNYSDYLIKKHSPDSYISDLYGFTSCGVLNANYDKLKEKVTNLLPDRASELSAPEIEDLRVNFSYKTYVDALNVAFMDEIERLLGAGRGITVDQVLQEGHLELLIKLSKPHNVDEILSEGEIKALSLALVLADCKLKGGKDPIVFDDPVNSLDNRITKKFIDELLRLDNQIILFSHNQWFISDVLGHRSVKECNSSTQTAGGTSVKKCVLPYEIKGSRAAKGIVIPFKSRNSRSFLDAAKRILDTVPFDPIMARQAEEMLRHAIECMVDEKIFCNLIPCKYRGANGKIPWSEFPNLRSISDSDIQTLQEQYNKISNGGLHLGYDAVEDELEHDDLEDVYDALNAL